MKVIDFDTKGNLLHLYFGSDGDFEYHGDDWDDYPYEYNAGPVYDRFIQKEVDFVFPYEYNVLEAKDDWHYAHNSPYCKDDFKHEKAPCVVVTKAQDEYSCPASEYSEVIADKKSLQIYFNDSMTEVMDNISRFGGVMIGETEWN